MLLKGLCWLDVGTAQELVGEPSGGAVILLVMLMPLYERMKPSSSDAAQLITSLTDLPDCVTWAIIFIIVA
jgi:hypothetical protein